ncbi:MAG: uncharacterized protein QOD94_445 [Alphaproteobacteria bacterium]|nr:uncharacterized protein [Alphaproteobacteria bacterium]
MAQTAKAQEPSMEEILASIRRIIADDERKTRPPEPSKLAPTAAPPEPATPPPEAPEPAPEYASAPPPRLAAGQETEDVMPSSMDAAVAKDSEEATDDRAADVLDLTESMAAPAPPPVFRTIEGQSDVFFSEQADPAPPPPRAEEPARPGREPDESPLMSFSTSAAVNAAFNTLAHTMLTQDARTREDLVTEMMRPMLKAWLDDNLPGLVERVVRAEIERVSRGRG